METAVGLDPLSTNIRLNYAVSLREVGRFEEALEQLEIAIGIDPEFSSAHDAIATIQWQVFNRLDMAAQGSVKAITLDPKRADKLYVWLAQLLSGPGRTGKSQLVVGSCQ